MQGAGGFLQDSHLSLSVGYSGFVCLFFYFQVEIKFHLHFFKFTPILFFFLYIYIHVCMMGVILYLLTCGRLLPRLTGFCASEPLFGMGHIAFRSLFITH